MSPVVLLVALGLGALGYREAARYVTATGRSPWGVPPLAWGAICTAAALPGAVFLYVSTRDNRSAANGDGALLSSVAVAVLGLFGLLFSVAGIAVAAQGTSPVGALVVLGLGGASSWSAYALVRWRRRLVAPEQRSSLGLRV